MPRKLKMVRQSTTAHTTLHLKVASLPSIVFLTQLIQLIIRENELFVNVSSASSW
jgi:hypothetical protein